MAPARHELDVIDPRADAERVDDLERFDIHHLYECIVRLPRERHPHMALARRPHGVDGVASQLDRALDLPGVAVEHGEALLADQRDEDRALRHRPRREVRELLRRGPVVRAAGLAQRHDPRQRLRGFQVEHRDVRRVEVPDDVVAAVGGDHGVVRLPGRRGDAALQDGLLARGINDPDLGAFDEHADETVPRRVDDAGDAREEPPAVAFELAGNAAHDAQRASIQDRDAARHIFGRRHETPILADGHIDGTVRCLHLARTLERLQIDARELAAAGGDVAVIEPAGEGHQRVLQVSEALDAPHHATLREVVDGEAGGVPLDHEDARADAACPARRVRRDSRACKAGNTRHEQRHSRSSHTHTTASRASAVAALTLELSGDTPTSQSVITQAGSGAQSAPYRARARSRCDPRQTAL